MTDKNYEDKPENSEVYKESEDKPENMTKERLYFFVIGIMSSITIFLLLFIILTEKGKIRFTWISDTSTPNAKVTGNDFREKVDRKTDLINQYLESYYMNDIDSKTMEDQICKGVLNGIGDEHAVYYTKEEYEKVIESDAGAYVGVGVTIAKNTTTGAISIVEVNEKGPAKKSGIKVGDIIKEVNGKKTDNMDTDTLSKLIRGKEGSQVEIKIYRPGEKEYRDFSVLRTQIREETVEHTIYEGDVGFIRINTFDDVTGQQFKEHLDKIKEKGCKGIVFDLRGNGGGSFQVVCDMLDMLIGKDLLVYTMNKAGEKTERKGQTDEELDLPMAVLVNEYSASASEIFSGALKDYNKAKLIGTKTYGKGTVQTVFDLGDGSAIKFTTEKYYTPKGICIDKTGLMPDIPVEIDKSTSGKYDKKGILKPDNQMQKAIEYIKSCIK